MNPEDTVTYKTVLKNKREKTLITSEYHLNVI